MAHGMDDNFPTGGMDADSADESINHGPNGERLPLNNYRYAKNIRAAINAAMRGKKLTNVKGNVQITKYILPYSNGVWPAGQNKCLGYKEDASGQTILYFVWNSAGNHQILQFFRTLTDPNNIYGQVQQIMMYNFGWTQNQRITGVNLIYNTALTSGQTGNEAIGDLLYFCDPIPKKINVTFANVCTKNKQWFFTSGQYNSFAVGGNFQLQLFDFNGVSLFNNSISMPAFNNPNLSTAENITAAWSFLAGQINQFFSTTFLATACNCGMTIEVLNGIGWTLSTSFNVKYWPLNWYGPTPTYQHFDACMYPILNVPSGTYLQDPSFLPNYVQKKVFQFRLEPYYHDLEQAVLGTWSQIPTNNLQCDGTDNPALNYIDVNFNAPQLTDANVLIVTSKINFIARELNTGSDKSVILLEPCDFLDYNTTTNQWYAHYKFYNNITPITVDADRAAVIYDNVPLTAGEELEVENRMVYTDIVTGYNAPECPITQFSVTMGQDQNAPLFKVKVRARILSFGLALQDQCNGGGGNRFGNFFPGNAPFPFVQIGTQPQMNRGGIFRNITAGTGAFFGGGNFNQAGAFGITDGMETRWNQLMGSSGFTIFTAGQPYYTITKQISIGLPTDNLNCLDTSTQPFVNAIGTYYNSVGLHLNGDLFSEGELLLPPGVYNLRVASHYCGIGDPLSMGYMYDLNNGLSYQKTSTNVGGVFIGGTFQKAQEITITVTNSDIDAGDFVIVDLTPPWDFKNSGGSEDLWSTYNMYLVDSSPFGTDPNDANFEGATVEKALVFVNNDVRHGSVLATQNWLWGSITDHNGYFFGINSDGGLGMIFSAFDVFNTQITQTEIFWSGSLTDLNNKNLASVNGITALPNNALAAGIITTTNPTSRAVCSTFVEGFITDSNNNPVNGALVVYQNGRTTKSFLNGTYQMLAWGDMVAVNLNNFPNFTAPNTPSLVSESFSRGVDSLIFSLGALCQPVYSIGQTLLINIFEFDGNPYNPANPFQVTTWTINEITNPEQKALKRGGKQLVCGRWYDTAGRCSTVVELLDLYIPTQTEDLSTHSVVNQTPFGLIYPANSFVPGKPTVYWRLISPPPIWAAYFQFMRTTNMITEDYLQWCINEVTYVTQIPNQPSLPEIDTAFANGDATAIKISLTNILDYQQRNAGTQTDQIGYSFVPTQRLRLIYDQNGILIPGINDFEIIAWDGALTIYIQDNGYTKELFAGTLVEIYLPLSLQTTNTQIEYECGEVVLCTNPGNSNNAYAQTQGSFTNGDTYWRGRNIPVDDPSTNFNVTYPVVIEDASKSDFYPSTAQDIGRIGTIDPNFVQLSDPTRLIASDEFLVDTAVNGLSAFTSSAAVILDITLDRKFGQNQRLFYEQNVLLVCTSTKEISLYIYRETIYNAQNPTGIQAQSSNFFGTQFRHTQNLGTDFRAVNVTNSGNVYGTRFNVANSWKYENNGERVISDIWMISFFQQLKLDGVTDAVAVYDRYYEEYIMTYWRQYVQSTANFTVQASIPPGTLSITYITPGNITPPINGTEIEVQIPLAAGGFVTYNGIVTSTLLQYDGTWVVKILITPFPGEPPKFGTPLILTVTFSRPETLAWNEGTGIQKLHNEAQVWRGFYDFTPEAYASLNTEIFSFVNGQIWIHDKNSLYNNFYGVQYPSYITPIFNDNPQVMKVWNAIWMIQYQADGTCSWSAPSITNTQGQQSRLLSVNFEQKMKNNWYQKIKGDLTDITVTNPIVNGRRMRSNALVVAFQNNSTGEIVLQEWRANATPSFRSIN